MNFKVRDEILNIKKYIVGKPISELKRELGIKEVVKLASNENPLGCSQKVKDALINLVDNTYLYPDDSNYELKKLLGEKLGVKTSQIFCGAGSDSLIKVICNTLLSKDDESIMGEITFPRYEVNTKLMGAKTVKIPMKELYLDIEAMGNAIVPKSKIIWFCNPNNPTGNMFTEKQFMKVLYKIPRSVYIVMDEAYAEYVTNTEYPDTIKFLDEFPNIIILRTFSKGYGLASLRVGYGIANECLVKYFQRVINPFDVNLYAQVGALEALKDESFLKKVKQYNKEQREFITNEFNNMGLITIDSQANFIMVKVECDDKDLFNYLLKKGYIVRPGYLLGIPKWLRISIGKEKDNKELIKLVKEYLKNK